MEFRFGSFATRVLFGGELSLPPTRPGGTLYVFDRHTRPLAGGGPALPAGQVVVLAPGEPAKSWKSVQAVLRAALRAGLGRDGLIVGVGGGMVCDVAAFAASLYMRGCRLALVPTSLLAMVDAALGGKTAINLERRKNLAGTFYPAQEIRVWTGALAGLPERELRSGLGEAVKTALLGDPELLRLLRERSAGLLGRDPLLLEEMVRRCLAVKGAIVSEDLQENGRRAVLNLGHTFAHALEAVTGLRRYSHGEAVAWGLARAAELAVDVGLAEERYLREVRELLALFGFGALPLAGTSPQRLLEAMQADKKRREGRLRLVLQRRIGDTVLREVEAGPILRALGAEAR